MMGRFTGCTVIGSSCTKCDYVITNMRSTGKCLAKGP